MRLDRFSYWLRWWKWFLFEGASARTLWFGPWRLDKRSRDILFRRWLESEPDFHGTYPYRKPR
jgi:hypothetical protein